MSQDDAARIVAAAQRIRMREGAGFPLTQLARPAGMSRATLYRRLAADDALSAEVERIRSEGVRSPREQFLHAATTLLTERGITELTMEAVAERAGLSIATLYRTFVDRETLVREVLRTSLPAEVLRNILSGDGTLEEVLVQFVNALLQRLHEHPHVLRFLLLRTSQDAREMRKFRREEERLSTSLIAFLEKHRAEFDGHEPRHIAASLMGQVLGAIAFQRSHDGFVIADGRTLVHLFLHGAKRRTTEKEGS